MPDVLCTSNGHVQSRSLIAARISTAIVREVLPSHLVLTGGYSMSAHCKVAVLV